MSQAYIATGTFCPLVLASDPANTECIPARFEIQDLKPDLGSGLVIEPQPPSLDYSYLAPFWGIAFTSVLFLWLFSHGIGHILKLVKNA